MTRTTEDRLLYLLKSRGPTTSPDAAAALGITAPGVQQHLSRMADAGLVTSEDRKHGRGRPRRYWGLTERGHARFPDRHSDLTLDILRSTEALFGADGLERLIAHREIETRNAYQEELSGLSTLEDRLEGLVRIRSREGYMAELEANADGSHTLVENHCPICAAARLCQGFCRAEIEVFRAVLGAGVRIEREEHLLAGARRCAYRITRKPVRKKQRSPP